MADTLARLRSEADRLLRSGSPAEAIAAHRNLLAHDPADAVSWFNLGWLLGREGQVSEALVAYDEALASGIDAPHEVHAARAAQLVTLRREDEALAAYQQCLELAPEFLPAMLNLGNLHEDRGDRVAAREVYGRAAKTHPGSGLALARLIGLTDDKTDGAQMLGAAQQLLASPQVPPEEKIDLVFAGAALLDRLQRYDEAWHWLQQANAASAQAMRASGRTFDVDSLRAFVDTSIASFTRPIPQVETSHQAPVFICGLFRSGSTLVEQILSRHPALTSGGELEIISRDCVAQFQPYPAAVANAGDADLAKTRALYFDRRAEQGIAPDISATDKSPDNVLHLGLVKALFPDARIVYTARDPLDNLLSLYFLHLGGDRAYATSLTDLAAYYREHCRLRDHWRSMFGEDFITVQYEDLVQSPEPTIRRLLDTLGLEWTAAVLNPEASAASVRTASVWQVRQPIHTRSVGRAANYAKQLKPLADALG